MSSMLQKQRVQTILNASNGSYISPSKGLTENGLAAMGYDCIVFRPGFLAEAERDRSTVRPIAETFIKPLFAFASYFTDAVSIPVSTLARSLCRAGELGTAGIPPSMKTTEAHDGISFTLIGNPEAISLADLPREA
ncbi:hypothetical protein EIP86_009883 [Pleurotus ostreatoroseus]|nr:hypothetical protein EIP86_009883 [Pleurotus ostreatoroseus]